jgi:GNAT superfamily N-acetyltransferase
MKLRLNADARDVKEFLLRHGYPWAEEWELTCLATSCLLTTLEAPNGDVAGHVWFNWVVGADHVLDTHICVDPVYQGRAITRRIHRDLIALAMRCGARTILCRPESPLHLSYLLRLGFEPHGPFVVLPLKESPWDNPSRRSSKEPETRSA